MAEFLKRLLGGGSDASRDADTSRDAGATETTESTFSGATDDVRQAADDGGGLDDMISDLLGGGSIPDPQEVQQAVEGLDRDELRGVSRAAVSELDDDTKAELGRTMSSYLDRTGETGIAQHPAGLTSGNDDDIADALSGLLKGQGLDGLIGMLGGGTPEAARDETGVRRDRSRQADDPLSSLLGGQGGSGAGLIGLLQSPLARQLIMALLPMLLKAFQGKGGTVGGMRQPDEPSSGTL